MPINFLDSNCSSISNNVKFGLCDDPPPSILPAYIDEAHSSTWIAEVNNKHEEEVTFYGIDNCITVLRTDGSMESRCDGVLLYANKLIFVELKERESGQWLKKGREQLTVSINLFKLSHNIMSFDNVEAYVCNSLKPIAHKGQMTNIQRFKNETGGLILTAKRIIDLK